MARDDLVYRGAEKQIEEARRSNAMELRLDGTELTELPESLGQLTQLYSLNLSKNQLTTLPEWLGQFTNLQSLDLSDNQLTVMSESLEWLSTLTQLRSLTLSNNQLTKLSGSLGQLTHLQSLHLSGNQLITLPEWLGQLKHLQRLDLSGNKLAVLPESLGQLVNLQALNLSGNQLTKLPMDWSQLIQLRELNLGDNLLTTLPESMRTLGNLKTLRFFQNHLEVFPNWIGDLSSLEILDVGYNKFQTISGDMAKLERLEQVYLGSALGPSSLDQLPGFVKDLKHLKILHCRNCQINSLPEWLTELKELKYLDLDNNPLNPELAKAYEQGLDAVKTYLRAKAEAQITLNEAKLILVGEGEVGKTSLLSALRGDPWVENRKSTEGVDIDIKSLVVKDPETGRNITLNGWDFGGQNIYRHTHQLFFTSPAVYLAVWNPRRGPGQCCVDEWIKMIKHRAYDETRHGERPRILVVATNGGPKERLDHIDERALRDEFGDLIAGFLPH